VARLRLRMSLLGLRRVLHLVPHLAQSFKYTSILDLRHYHEKDVYQYIQDNNINMVLFVYSDSNLSGDMFKFKK
ncbi:hypothetical protein ACT453_54090, partial [Bacillus sp. D-CC]